ncbi:16S rRNA (uracil(1498)-N(3))-methyltransferase [Pelotomaculum sp. PtaB.Bin117]|uniref:16S rRNA (uracil(1498)-N(3))-methyltransferase n=1 Tax=Pelotomaculum sp. PtaB.Bin117 TaxID=1811694 RepID=UPI0009C86A0F|nr:16S rRNA (uracil(1498)-N(3))-methyltransferase [Pelotomaculum sp. PtaB.Bin117]OPX87064.1 MAG: Ribosomal RNA small subunit methyltransferase E [Pelotomaculum sp. PtaB.Bin117]
MKNDLGLTGYPHFFFSAGQIKTGRVYINGPDFIHISKVLRLRPGEKLILMDGLGKSYLAGIEDIAMDQVVCALQREISMPAASFLRITLVQGIPKGDKMDLIIQKGTELGVSVVIPLFSERTLVKLDRDKAARRLERWQRIALEASKQCRRYDVPEICRPQSWEEVLAGLLPGAPALIPWEEEAEYALKAFSREHQKLDSIYIFIGPEGGFTREEVERARLHGVLPVTLGPRILRTETAGLAVLAMVQYQWGDLGG